MGEDLDKYEITAADLGQDAELDPGVVEEAVASGETKQPISKCFTAIPFEARKKYRKLYDSMDVKDMPFEDFAIELHFMQSQMMMNQDLKAIIDQKHMGNRRMAADLYNIKKNLN